MLFYRLSSFTVFLLLQLCLIGELLSWNEHHQRGAEQRRAAEGVFPVCFRTVDSSQGPAVSKTACSTSLFKSDGTSKCITSSPAQHDAEPGTCDADTCTRWGSACFPEVISTVNKDRSVEDFFTLCVHHCVPAAVCGQRSSTVTNITQPRSRIIGGSPAPRGSWPWLVNLQLDGGLMCGGVLVDKFSINVLFFFIFCSIHSTSSENYYHCNYNPINLLKYIIPPNSIIFLQFNPKTFNNDIALVELTSPVVLSEHVIPVCLPSATEPPTGSPCLVAGWGSLYEDGPSADVVMEAKVPLLPQSTCKSALGKDLVTNTMLCAGYLSGGIDSCQGDSGGPLIYKDRLSGRFQLYGITSWGDGCGEKGKPGVYTRVAAFSDWIQAEIHSKNEKATALYGRIRSRRLIFIQYGLFFCFVRINQEQRANMSGAPKDS
uniref:Peptidase S1 domain-containing protein n=1 Tax=Gouania willdenowi TaxID=441366 RepID=A0A8C5GI30_GOUWI